MELQQITALTAFVGVYLLFSTRLVHRAIAALLGALVLAAVLGLKSVLGPVLPEVLLTSAGLMVLAGFFKRSGLASWLALKAAKAGRGQPHRILVLTGLLSFVLGTLFGPGAAVVLTVPVALLLAVELDVAVLPFVVVLSWTALLGGATVLTAQPSNLWVASALGLSGGTWLAAMAPLTLTGLGTTLILGVTVFGRQLRVTHERRARVLEYDENRSIGDRALLAKTLTVLGLVACGLVGGPLVGLSGSVVVLGGAVLLILWDGPGSVDRALAEIDAGLLVFFGGLMAVVGALGSTGLAQAWASAIPVSPLGLLWTSALLGTGIDHGAVTGALVPMLRAWDHYGLWQATVLGTTLGAGATVWGSAPGALALGLSVQGGRRPSWKEFTGYGLVFAIVNLGVITLLALVL